MFLISLPIRTHLLQKASFLHKIGWNNSQNKTFYVGLWIVSLNIFMNKDQFEHENVLKNLTRSEIRRSYKILKAYQ